MPSLILLLGLTACSSYQEGFHRDRVREAAAGPAQVTDQTIAAELAKRPQLPKPFRLGVFFREPVARVEGGRLTGERARFTPEEKRALLEGLRQLPPAEVAAVIPVSTEGEAGDLRAIRLAAARHGAHAVLVLSAAGEELTEPNDGALSYLLLLPALFVRGTDVSTLFLARAGLWDVRNEYLYLSAQGEAEEKRARPALAKGLDAQARRTRAEAWARLREELGRQFTALLAPRAAAR